MAGLVPAISILGALRILAYENGCVLLVGIAGLNNKPGDDMVSGWSDAHAVAGSHRNPSPQRVIRPHDGDGKCAGQHSVPVSQ